MRKTDSGRHAGMMIMNMLLLLYCQIYVIFCNWNSR